MTARPWKPAEELDGALERGDLKHAITLAAEVAEDLGRPIDLDTALRFLPLAAGERDAYNAWACRWLARWLAEAPGATIDGAAEIAGAVADLPAEPTALDASARGRGLPRPSRRDWLQLVPRQA